MTLQTAGDSRDQLQKRSLHTLRQRDSRDQRHKTYQLTELKPRSIGLATLGNLGAFENTKALARNMTI